MAVPPFITAFIRAELLCLAPRILFYFHPAARADALIPFCRRHRRICHRYSVQPFPPAEWLHCVLRNSKFLRNLYISTAIGPHLPYPVFLPISHEKRLLIIRRFENGFIHPQAQKKSACRSKAVIVPHYTEIWGRFWIPMDQKNLCRWHLTGCLTIWFWLFEHKWNAIIVKNERMVWWKI